MQFVESEHQQALARERQSARDQFEAKWNDRREAERAKIKEQTIKGLEPEIAGILKRHQEERQRDREQFDKERGALLQQLEDERQRGLQREQVTNAQHEQRMLEWRQQHQSSVQMQLQDERQRHQDKLRAVCEKYEAALSDIRQSLAEQQQRLAAERQRQDQSIQQQVVRGFVCALFFRLTLH